MEPSATPPWRVLETPTSDTTDHGRADAPTPPPNPTSSIVKVGIIVGGAIACAGLAVVLALGSGGGSVSIEGGAPLVADGSGAVASPSDRTAGVDLVVEIVGAVPNPGVYRLPAGSRVGDLVRMAGGYGPRVDTERAEQELNLAAPVTDGEHIRVPSRDDTTAVAQPGGETGSDPGGGGLVDINAATQAELEVLPGVGPATAEKIIAAREEAPFGAVEELRSRGVLGEKTFEKLRALMTVG
jgi:competence protein ComEA